MLLTFNYSYRLLIFPCFQNVLQNYTFIIISMIIENIFFRNRFRLKSTYRRRLQNQNLHRLGLNLDGFDTQLLDHSRCFQLQ